MISVQRGRQVRVLLNTLSVVVGVGTGALILSLWFDGAISWAVMLVLAAASAIANYQGFGALHRIAKRRFPPAYPTD